MIVQHNRPLFPFHPKETDGTFLYDSVHSRSPVAPALVNRGTSGLPTPTLDPPLPPTLLAAGVSSQPRPRGLRPRVRPRSRSEGLGKSSQIPGLPR